MKPEVISQIFELIVFPLLFVLTGFIIQFIKTKTQELKTKTNNETQQKYLTMFEDTITTCVLATNQTYVDALKKEGKFDAEAQKKAFELTKDAVLTILTEDAKEYLTELYGDLNKQLTSLIEAQVKVNKNI